MKKFWFLPAVVIALIIIICLIDISGVDQDAQSNATEDREPTASNNQDELSPPARQNPAQPDARLARLPDGHVQYNPALEVSRALGTIPSTEEALMLVEQLLSHYRFAYKENPVGVENFEITEQLLGKNPKKIVFIAPDSAALRGNELIDQWGTPYFFHAVSGQQMDIRSAGPDQILWTDDDITLTEN